MECRSLFTLYTWKLSVQVIYQVVQIRQNTYLIFIVAIPFPGNQTSVLLWHDGSEEPRAFPKQSYVASVHLVAH